MRDRHFCNSCFLYSIPLDEALTDRRPRHTLRYEFNAVAGATFAVLVAAAAVTVAPSGAADPLDPDPGSGFFVVGLIFRLASTGTSGTGSTWGVWINDVPTEDRCACGSTAHPMPTRITSSTNISDGADVRQHQPVGEGLRVDQLSALDPGQVSYSGRSRDSGCRCPSPSAAPTRGGAAATSGRSRNLSSSSHFLGRRVYGFPGPAESGRGRARPACPVADRPTATGRSTVSSSE